jgi:predicted short-subunit dehydrogenase-like oxidoreductase (DUF2520 family)
MRELELQPDHNPLHATRLAVVGGGRLGSALAAALTEAGVDVGGPFGRGFTGTGYDVVLLCVPDGSIETAAAAITGTPILGHCSGATGLGVLGGHEGFSLHPLMTVTASRAQFEHAGAAIAGTTGRALSLARSLALALGMLPVHVNDADRVAYHAAACIASNFLVTIESAAERIAGTAGVDRALLVPLVRATVENWAVLGPEPALTGPIARGDEATVQAQRRAIAERTPELLGLFDALADATRSLAAAGSTRAA